MKLKKETVLAAFGQLNRDEEFRILTKIIQINSLTFVRKEAYSEKAISHIKSLEVNHSRLSKALSDIDGVRLVKIQNSEESFIDFEYIEGQNVEYRAFRHVLSGDYTVVTELVDRIFNLIDNLSSARDAHETDASKLVNDTYSSSADAKYLSPGIVDLNLDNFILTQKNDLVAFDYEWIFDNSIAADFVKTRLLYTFFARRSDAFGFLPNESKPFTIISAGETRTYVPTQIYTKYAEYLSGESMVKYLRSEDVFQKTVNSHHKNNADRDSVNLMIEESSFAKQTFPEVNESLNDRYVSASNQVQQLEGHVQHLESELTQIKLSLAYRLALKLRSIKSKLF